MKPLYAALPLLIALPDSASAADCSANAPAFSPVTETFEAKCRPGQQIVSVVKAKSPVVKLNFESAQEVTISTHSGAQSPGHNGKNAQVCIWRSWEMSTPCGASAVQSEFNAWDGKASCSVVVPAGPQYVRAWQMNESADEINTTIHIQCR